MDRRRRDRWLFRLQMLALIASLIAWAVAAMGCAPRAHLHVVNEYYPGILFEGKRCYCKR